MKKIALKMSKHYKGINVGEVAGYPEDIADKLVEKGYGKYYDKKTEPKKSDVSHALTALEMKDVKELMDGKVDDIKKELVIKSSTGSYLYPAKYVEEALDFESLNKARSGLMDWILEELGARDEG